MNIKRIIQYQVFSIVAVLLISEQCSFANTNKSRTAKPNSTNIRILRKGNSYFGKVKSCRPHSVQKKSSDKQTDISKLHIPSLDKIENCRKNIKKKALAVGISENVASFLDHASFLSKNAELSRAQVSNKPRLRSFDESIDRFKNVNMPICIKKLSENRSLFKKLERDFGVNKELIVSIWAKETMYGANVGRYRAIDALFTLTVDDRRHAFFEAELIAFLHLVNDGVLPWDVISSYDGGIGQCQFMPSSIRKYAIGHDRKGRLDLIHDKAAALSSIANFYANLGWNMHEPIIAEVIIPENFDVCLIGGNDGAKTIAEWRKLGITAMTNGVGESDFLQEEKQGNKAYLLVPKSANEDFNSQDRAFLLYDNGASVYRWNGSTEFVISVCRLVQEMISNKS